MKIDFTNDAFTAYWSFEKCLAWAKASRCTTSNGLIDGVSWIQGWAGQPHGAV
jgi:hypothetical protein